MPKNSKGRRPGSDLVSVNDAARMLEVTVQTLHNWHLRGIIEAEYKDGGSMKYFRMHDIAALCEAKDKKVDMTTVLALSMKAYVIARSNELRLKELYDSMGLELPRLGVTEEAVVSLYARIENALDYPPEVEVHVFREWARTFYAITEPYLNLVNHFTGLKEPWVLPMELGKRMMLSIPDSTQDPAVLSAREFLRISYNNMRHVAYFYCIDKYGRALANRLFNEPKDSVSNVCRILFPNLPGVFRAS